MSQNPNQPRLFERATEYPDPEAHDRLARLVGMDDKIHALANLLGVLVNPEGLRKWQQKHHAEALHLVHSVIRRPPLVVLSGDVGSGKTELAETIGDRVARQQKIPVTLMPLSLASRGKGMVGEMTQLVSSAFDQALAAAEKLKTERGAARGAIILLVDEADALAQSRETDQMHHEDKAGVNAFIRGVDRLANSGVPAAVIMCTNRLHALDPAVRRRAAEIMVFSRPTATQRLDLFTRHLAAIDFNRGELSALVQATGESAKRDHGFSYSDIMQRLLPAVVLDAYPDHPIRAKRVIEIAENMLPTPVYQAC